jgi:hypothetical protein
MTLLRTRSVRSVHSILVAALLLPGLAAAADGKVTARKLSYHGWPDCILLSNGRVEAVLVPAIGRIMQFRFAGEEDGPFWENRALDGKAPDPQSAEWGNFGGDKSWPAPQSDWPKVTPRAWPPPRAFDSMPAQAGELGADGSITLTTAVDPHYGIRAIRFVSLSPSEPKMVVRTVYEKGPGQPANVAVWIITQFKEPAGLYIPLPEKSSFKQGYVLQSGGAPPSLKVEGRLLSMRRQPKGAFKIGTEGETLLWLGEKLACRIDSPREAGRNYPDNGCSAEIYTNPDPAKYIELETLGPLQVMKSGDRLAQTSTYTLLRRTENDPPAEAKRILNP